MIKGIYRHKKKASSRDTSIPRNDSSINQDSQVLQLALRQIIRPF